jgi:hypothetical protein
VKAKTVVWYLGCFHLGNAIGLVIGSSLADVPVPVMPVVLGFATFGIIAKATYAKE